MKRIQIAAGLLAALILGGAVSAAAAQGGQDDPLVTLSYLTDVLTPKLEGQLTQVVSKNEQALVDKLNAAIDGYAKDMDAALAGGGGGAAFSATSLTAGQSWTGKAGQELLMRSGTATAVGELLDTTTGTTVAQGGALAANHLYVLLSDGAGMKAGGTVSAMIG